MSALRLLLPSAGRLLAAALRSLRPPPSASPAVTLGRVLVMVGFVPLFALIQGLHWIGLLLDELLFQGYRQVQIREPLFVLGVPRSGTTHLHRVLAQDPQFTTFSTWECLLAPSITERRLWMGLGRIDACIGRPLGRLLGRLEGWAFGGMAGVHSMTLQSPEEDYLALMPVFACFILILPFPTDPYLWRLGTFDRDMPAEERARLLAFYRGLLQRHLYVHGPRQRLLSKNAAFAPLAGSLRETFPDARFLVCLREPAATLPSQLSSLEPGLRFFRVLAATPDFRERLARQLGFYYENLERALGDLPEDRCAWVTLDGLKQDLAKTLGSVYRRLELEMAESLRDDLRQETERSRGYRSGHSYSPDAIAAPSADLVQQMTQTYGRLAARAVPDLDGAFSEPSSGPGGLHRDLALMRNE